MEKKSRLKSFCGGEMKQSKITRSEPLTRINLTQMKNVHLQVQLAEDLTGCKMFAKVARVSLVQTRSQEGARVNLKWTRSQAMSGKRTPSLVISRWNALFPQPRTTPTVASGPLGADEVHEGVDGSPRGTLQGLVHFSSTMLNLQLLIARENVLEKILGLPNNHGYTHGANLDEVATGFEAYTPLNATRAYILNLVKSLGILSKLPSIKSTGRRMYSSDRCTFHDDIGHKKEDCFTLKDAIEVVQNGELVKFINQGGP
ncbi:hypothetical protein PVK06_004582 [Gossypium arboreum]|uniref:Uncharacterized protein n=1 Tax=Gossypium arboreum TaxID=29729 RepID=A0ABR0QSD2_GOSAR|nr:hypothetical protein PVK06_004582 [Gossypium arboreum]